MADPIHLEAEDLSAAMAAWRANVPDAVTYPELSAADDVATTQVLAAIAHWPGEHRTMATNREDAANRFSAAAAAATRILTTGDEDGAGAIAMVEDV
jgi:hypothetical protein